MSMIHQISESSAEPSTSAGVGGGLEECPLQSGKDAAKHPSPSKDKEYDGRPMPRSRDAVPSYEMTMTGNGMKQGEDDDAAAGHPRKFSNQKPNGDEREGKRLRVGTAKVVEDEDEGEGEGEGENEDVHRSGGKSHHRCDALIGNAANSSSSSHRPEPENPLKPTGALKNRLVPASFTWNTSSNQGGQHGGRGRRGMHMSS